jgi:hypothetical protein
MDCSSARHRAPSPLAFGFTHMGDKPFFWTTIDLSPVRTASRCTPEPLLHAQRLFSFVDPRPSVPARFVRAQGQDHHQDDLASLDGRRKVSATATKCRRSTLRKPKVDAVRENMLVLDQNDVQFWT